MCRSLEQGFFDSVDQRLASIYYHLSDAVFGFFTFQGYQ